MSRTELGRYKAMLEAKQGEVATGLVHRDDIDIERAADKMDEVQLSAERELTIRNLDRESALLRRIRSALRRLAGGSYGVCLRCEGEIKAKRLEAVPWTEYCIRCQEAADRQELESDLADLVPKHSFHQGKPSGRAAIPHSLVSS